MRITEFEEKNRLLATQGFGAKYLLNGKWVETGALGNYNCISFNGNNVLERVREVKSASYVGKYAA